MPSGGPRRVCPPSSSARPPAEGRLQAVLSEYIPVERHVWRDVSVDALPAEQGAVSSISCPPSAICSLHCLAGCFRSAPAVLANSTEAWTGLAMECPCCPRSFWHPPQRRWAVMARPAAAKYPALSAVCGVDATMPGISRSTVTVVVTAAAGHRHRHCAIHGQIDGQPTVRARRGNHLAGRSDHPLMQMRRRRWLALTVQVAPHRLPRCSSSTTGDGQSGWGSLFIWRQAVRCSGAAHPGALSTVITSIHHALA